MEICYAANPNNAIVIIIVNAIEFLNFVLCCILVLWYVNCLHLFLLATLIPLFFCVCSKYLWQRNNRGKNGHFRTIPDLILAYIKSVMCHKLISFYFPLYPLHIFMISLIRDEEIVDFLQTKLSLPTFAKAYLLLVIHKALLAL